MWSIFGSVLGICRGRRHIFFSVLGFHLHPVSEAIPAGTDKVVLKVKGQSVPVVVSGRYLVEAFPVDMVVLLPNHKPGIVMHSSKPTRKVAVMDTELGESDEYEPEQLTPLEELE